MMWVDNIVLSGPDNLFPRRVRALALVPGLARTTRSPGPNSACMKRGTKSSYLDWLGMRMSYFVFVFGLRAYVRRNRVRVE